MIFESWKSKFYYAIHGKLLNDSSTLEFCFSLRPSRPKLCNNPYKLYGVRLKKEKKHLSGTYKIPALGVFTWPLTTRMPKLVSQL